MSCCAPTIIPFYNTSNSTVSYSEAMRSVYGRVPQVQILYYDSETDGYYVSTSGTEIVLTGNPVDLISIDHGGAQTGVIRIV